MVIEVKISFKGWNFKEIRLYEEMCNTLLELEKKINKKDFNVYCSDRCDEGFIMGDYDLPDDVFGEIYVECDDIYKELVMTRIEGTKNFVNYLLR